MFACGTAAVITPVGRVRHSGGEWSVGEGNPGPVTERLRETLLNIQHGRTDDVHRWMHSLVPAADAGAADAGGTGAGGASSGEQT